MGVANLFFISKGSNSLKASMPETHRLWSGAASEDSPRTDSGNAMLGVTLTLLGALALAGRLIADELALEGTDLHPFQVIIILSPVLSTNVLTTQCSQLPSKRIHQDSS